jgi:predicted  nucleic acid-binding Zn-ribbon protein
MFSKTRENYEQEFVSLRKRADKFEQQASDLRGELETCRTDLKTERDKIAVLESEKEQLAAALDVEHNLTVAERQVRSPEHSRAIVEALVLAAQNAPMSIELERAVATGVAWLEQNKLKEGD